MQVAPYPRRELPEDPAGWVCLSRDGFGDPRRIWMPVGKVRFPHLAVETGGQRKWLPWRMLAVYIDSTLYPVEWRSGEHPERWGMPLLVEREWTDPAVYVPLLEEGEKHPYSVERAQRRRERWAEKQREREAA